MGSPRKISGCYGVNREWLKRLDQAVLGSVVSLRVAVYEQISIFTLSIKHMILILIDIDHLIER
jgi:hypothetical protein